MSIFLPAERQGFFGTGQGKTVAKNDIGTGQFFKNVIRLYQQYNRIPTDEEYQAVRTMILYKVALEDKNVMNVLSDCTWEALRAGAV